MVTRVPSCPMAGDTAAILACAAYCHPRRRFTVTPSSLVMITLPLAVAADACAMSSILFSEEETTLALVPASSTLTSLPPPRSELPMMTTLVPKWPWPGLTSWISLLIR